MTRSFAVTLLVILLVALNGQAHAYRIFAETNYAGEVLSVGDTISVGIHLDTQGDSDIILLSIGVLWDSSVLSLRSDLSYHPSYILYSPAAGMTSVQYLNSHRINPLQLWPFPPPSQEQVNIEYVDHAFPFSAAGTIATSADELMAELVFEIIGAGTGDITTAFTPSNLFALSRDGDLFDVTDQVALDGSPITVVAGAAPPGPEPPVGAIPEPVSAVLFAAGAVLVALRIRRRDRR